MNKDYKHIYLSLLDILGFSDFVKANSHDEITVIYDSLFQVIVQGCLCHGKVDVHGTAAKLRESAIQLNSLMISDSVLLWSDTDSKADFEEIVWVTRAIMDSSFRTGLPLRGTIANGALSFRSSEYAAHRINLVQALVGRVIVDAHEESSKQQWSGCVVLDDCISNYIRQFISPAAGYLRLENLVDDEGNKLVTRYDVPYKNQVIQNHFVINWVRDARVLPNETTVVAPFSIYKKEVTAPDVAKKIENTLNFWRSTCKNPGK